MTWQKLIGIKYTKTPPISQQYKCSKCGEKKWGISDIAEAYEDGTLICYECKKLEYNDLAKTRHYH